MATLPPYAANCWRHTTCTQCWAAPQKVFQGASVTTVLLFWEKGRKTQSTWYSALGLERSLSKSYPLREDVLAEFVTRQKTRAGCWTAEILAQIGGML
ncbi:hypothetical protein [Sulfitobacter guttiformis]|uniref:hypothetical protein n=1 Tax=Sulfitobacter guttiformis TaxID=74349 RepID=UPI00046AEF4E|nr:hypothetical protein [Sulfitobacter guttiformis]KIN72037.1 Putaticve type I restriction enzyme methyltransferase subunit [Sulfitobacter guttiformis KCTC 32187]